MTVPEGYAAARQGAAFVPLPERALLAVTGPLRQKFLHNILSNDVLGLTPGQGRRAALMDVKGRLLAIVRVQVDETTVWLEVPAAKLQAVEALLVHYKVAAPVRFATPPLSVLAVIGPLGMRTLSDIGLAVPDLAAPEAHAPADQGTERLRVGRAGDLPAHGLVVHGTPAALGEIARTLEAAGASLLAPGELDALRVEDGRPWYGPDITEENLLHETGLVRELHSSTKGCYVGQEVIARLEARGGNVNKRLRGLRLGAPLAAGAPLHLAGRAVGMITTSAVSPRLGAIAMGYVHRSAADAGTALEAGITTATVGPLPFADEDA